MTQTTPEAVAAPEGPVTLYLEFRVASPEHDAAMGALTERASAWRQSPGFLSLMLKQMSGDSTTWIFHRMWSSGVSLT
ncbi:hypothetical protein [Mycobacterium servetii]|uniref:hypothetical protein n=1 Tax=Mycobacterium servetii TaxID=3237418 RepID=UPI003B585DA2